MLSYTRKTDSTDVSVIIRIIDATDGTPETGVVYNTSGIDLQYRREGATSAAITEATLATLDAAHSDGGLLHVGNGYYRLDLPDAACAAGAAGVLVHGTVTGMVVLGCYVQLVAYDPSSAANLGLSSLAHLDSALELNDGLYRLTVAALANAATATIDIPTLVAGMVAGGIASIANVRDALMYVDKDLLCLRAWSVNDTITATWTGAVVPAGSEIRIKKTNRKVILLPDLDIGFDWPFDLCSLVSDGAGGFTVVHNRDFESYYGVGAEAPWDIDNPILHREDKFGFCNHTGIAGVLTVTNVTLGVTFPFTVPTNSRCFVLDRFGTRYDHGMAVEPDVIAAIGTGTGGGQYGVTMGLTYPLVRRDGVINIPRGDVFLLTGTLNAAFSLAGKDVWLHVAKKKGATPIIHENVTITSVGNRTWSFTTTTTHTAIAGQYKYELRLHDTGTEDNPQTAESGVMNIIDGLEE